MTPRTTRVLWLLIALVTASCAASGGDAADLEAVTTSTGLYHLPNRVDAASLELREDQTFRWSFDGCDTFTSDRGLVRAEGERVILLLPAAGHETFAWPTALSVSKAASVRLERAGDDLVELESGLRWVPGGVCAICGGPFGPTGQQACDRPSMLD